MSEEIKQEERAYNARENDKNKYQEIMEQQQAMHDKYIFIIAGGLYNLMIIFIEKIIKLEDAYFITFFNLSLLSSALAICSVLISFKYSADEAHIAYETVNNGEDYNAGVSSNSKKIDFTNKIATYCTIISIILTTFFITINLWLINTQKIVINFTFF